MTNNSKGAMHLENSQKLYLKQKNYAALSSYPLPQAFFKNFIGSKVVDTDHKRKNNKQ
jgi:hypothetical protein